MMRAVKDLLARHGKAWKNKQFLLRVFLHLTFLTISVFLTYVAVDYTDTYTGYVVPDLLLDHIPIMDVGFIFFQGSFIFILSLLGLAVLIPEAIPFGLASTALFFLVRAGFMSMTHLSAPFIAHYSYIDYGEKVPQVVFSMTSGNDMFFSGHAGYPFMLAIMFWRYRYLKFYLLLCSIISGVAVIIGHLHYSIDVFSAFFIGYGIFEIAKKAFGKEYAFFAEEKPSDQIKVKVTV